MATSTVKLIIQIENLAKQQLQLMHEQMEKLKAVSLELDAALNSIDANRLNNVNRVAQQSNESLKLANNNARLLKNSINSINPQGLRQVNASAVKLQSVMLAIMRNVSLFNNLIYNKKPNTFNQITTGAKQLDTTLIAVKGSANQLDRAFDTIDARAITVVDAKAVTLKEKLLSIIPSAKEVRNSIQSIGSVNFSGLTSKIDGVKSKLSSLGGSSKYTTNGFGQLNVGSRLAGVGLGFLRNAASMTVGMIGYDLFNSIMQSGRAAINASSQLQYFANRLEMTPKEVSNLKSELSNLQSQFKKVNMTAVGAAAEEMAVKLNLGKNSVKELTEVTAVMSSAFVKEGRTQEDAILAVSDAMDGQFRRLQELGISEEMLMKNGWDGDINNKTSLLKAMNKTLAEMGFTKTAKDITNLDDAYQALTVAGGRLMEKILVPITPLLMQMADGAMAACDIIMGAIDGLTSAWNGLPDWAKDAVGVGLFTLALTALSIFITASLIPTITGGLISAMTSLGTIIGITILPTATLSGAFGVLAGAIWSALSPLLPFIAAAAIAAVVIYEIGKAFNWWHDVGSMLEAIWAGLQRLWSAFINHPDVQAIIKALSDGWNWLSNAIGAAWNALLKFLGVSTGGKFDVVHAIIVALGQAWQLVTFPIRTVISIIQFLIGAFQNTQKAVGDVINVLKPFGDILLFVLGPIGWVILAFQKLQGFLGGNGGLSGALQKVQQVFTTVWSAIYGFISGIVGPIISMFQTLYSTLVQLWNGQISLGDALGKIWQTISSTITQVITHIVESIINFATTIGQWAIKAGQAFLTGLISFFTKLPGMIWNILTGVITSIASLFGTGVSDQVGGALKQLGEVFSTVWQTISAVVGGVIGPLIDMVVGLIDVFQQLWDGQIGLGEAIGMIWETIISNISEILNNLDETIANFALTFGEWAMQAGSWFLTNIMSFLSQVPGFILSILTNAYNYIVNSMSQWIGAAVNGASTLVNQVVSFFSQLPGMIWNWLVQVGTRIIAAGTQWVNNARAKASAIVSGVISYVSQLPGKVYQEFINIGNRMLQAGSQLVERAKKIGQDIVKGLLNAMGIHSPGIIQTKVVAEFVNMLANVKNKAKDGYNYAKEVGRNIVNGFDASDVQDSLNVDIAPNVGMGEVDTGVNVSQDNGESGTGETGDSYGTLTDTVSVATESINLNNELIGDSFNTLTENISLNTGIIQSRVSGIVTSFNSTQLGVSTSLSTMTNKNTSAWNNIKSTTQSNLNAIRTSTSNVTTNMIHAWGTMKNNIVASANDIRTQSYNKFSSLHRSISSFYNQLASARFSSGLPAGPGSRLSRITRGRIGRSSPIGGKISSGRSGGNYAGGLGTGRGRFIDTNSKVRRKQSSDSASYSNLLDYNLPADIMEDIARLNGCANPSTCFAGIVDTNVSKIVNTAYPWKIADPWFLGIQIPSDFKVRDFKDGKQPTINPGNFESLLRKILTARGFNNPGTYEFYYNSKRSNQQVWDQVRCNCFDGAEMILEIGRMLGMSGHMVHGSWNGIGHVAAMINGQIYDMTQFQKRGGIFRGGSGVSFGSTSGSTGGGDIFSKIFNKIDEIAGFIKNGATNFAFNNNVSSENNIVTYSHDDVTLTVDHNLNINVTGDTENLDTKTLIDSLRELITDSKLVDAIAEALLKRERKLRRMGGM
ncbi:MAG: phage tail protein [Methanobrevibacter sp.]|nr:phage tail protein [Methanobrevibacter sp.]